MIFDSHSHYYDDAYNDDRDEVLSSLAGKGVSKAMLVSAEWDSLEKVVNLCHKYSFLYPILGIHPSNSLELTKERKPLFEQLIANEKPYAIGEIGLDYYWPEPEHDVQKEIFKYQLELANKFELPVSIHSRDAKQETFDILKEANVKKGGVIHCYSGSAPMALDYIEMGYCIGVGGVVTFKNSVTLKEVVKAIPLSSILLETDCPYLAPVPFRGKRNESSYLTYVANEIASIKGVSVDEVVQKSYDNTVKLFSIKD